MDAKITVTTRCNARCKTCPVWCSKKEDMMPTDFARIMDALVRDNRVTRILINNTGDIYNHPDRKELFEIMEGFTRYKAVIMTTNGGRMDYIPRIHSLVISFNGGTKEAYEYTVGLPFEKTVENIKSFYNDMILKVNWRELHCLIWDGNEGSEEFLLDTWSDFPGRVRVSYKYDNQMKEDHTVEGYVKTRRIPCDYLNMLSIMPDGQIISCAHDFEKETDFGNILVDTMDEVWQNKARLEKRREHMVERYTGICERCNYNTPMDGKIKYLN
jgi:radical SAM protein with 4Fe4S-binding SPASM domain